MVVVVVDIAAVTTVFAWVGAAGVITAITMFASEALLADTLVRAECVDAFAAIRARIVQALIDVEFAVRSVEAFVTVAAVREGRGDTNAVGAARVLGAVIHFLAVVTLPTHGARASVIGQGLEAASSSILTRTVRARVVGDGDLAEGGLVADGAGTFEGGATGGGHDDGARAAILALLSARVTWVFVLTVFSGESRWALASSAS